MVMAARRPSGAAPHDERSLPARFRDNPLTPREREILTLAAWGLTNPQIAARLSLQPQTVKNQLSGLYNKLGARARTQAVAMALEAGWLIEASLPR